jgi:3-oxoacyl-[acyl-carrier protein] reductase
MITRYPFLAGKNAVVTGASKGIGAEIAKRLAAEGAAVVVNYASDTEGAGRVVAEITAAGGKAVAIGADVSNPDDIVRFFGESAEFLGAIDILVNNAGIYELSPLEEITTEHFHRLFNINVLGLILCTREALKHFNPQGGSIINTSSVVSVASPAYVSVYGATKAAVDGLTRSFSKELAGRKIRVNTINPGPIETDGVHALGLAETVIALGEQTALGRVGQPEDIAPGVVFLASDVSSWMTGESLHINGGLK